MNLVDITWRILGLFGGRLLLQRQAGGCAACNAMFDLDLEQGGNINVVVRRDPATGKMTRALAHRWCRPGRSSRSISYVLADP